MHNLSCHINAKTGSSVKIVVIIFLVAAPGMIAAQHRTFTRVPQAVYSNFQVNANEILGACMEGISIAFFSFDPSVVSAQSDLDLHQVAGISFSMAKVDPGPARGHRWVVSDSRRRIYGLLRLVDGRISGRVHLSGKAILILPYERGMSMFMMVPFSGSYLDVTTCDIAAGTAVDTIELAASGDISCCVIRVLGVVSSCAASGMREVGQDPEHVFRELISSANSAYADSNVLPRLQLAHVYEAEYGFCDPEAFGELGRDFSCPEGEALLEELLATLVDVFTGEVLGVPSEDVCEEIVNIVAGCPCPNVVKDDLLHLQNSTDGQLDEIHDLLDLYAADVAIFITGYSVCGGMACGIPGTLESAFAVVPRSAGTHGFVHEMGHLQGAGHARPRFDEDYVAYSPFPYGYGYRSDDDSIGTVMSYLGNRLLRFSNPSVTLDSGAATGTEFENNARVLNETACKLAMIRSKGRISVYPTRVFVRPGGSVLLTIDVGDAGGPVAGAPTVAGSSDSSVARVTQGATTNAAGKATLSVLGVASGTAKISIRSQGAVRSVEVVVSSFFP